jgi:glycosyltransferase involved in cell wall biosynthesis
LWLGNEKIDHVHAHFGTNSAEVAMLAHVLGGPKWSFTVHGPEEFDKARSIGLSEKIRRSQFVVAISSFGRSQLYRLVDHTVWPKVRVVRCGLDESLFAVPRSISCAMRFVCVGRLCEQKGQLLLIEAVHRLISEGRKFELVLAGDGELRNDLEVLIARYRLRDFVSITGWLTGERVQEEILSARAMILPSFAEGLPVVLMEAMALHRPVISTYVGGISELVSPGEHGWLVPSGDVVELANAISACLETSADKLAQMGQAAYQRAYSLHTSTTQAHQLSVLFSSNANCCSVG